MTEDEMSEQTDSEQGDFSARPKLLAAAWFIVGVIIAAAPYMAHVKDETVLSLSHIFGTLFISSGALATVNTMYLRRSQLLQTRSVLNDLLGKRLGTFRTDINDAFITRLEWAKAIEAVGLKNVTLEIPRLVIKERLQHAQSVHITWLFLRYAAVNGYETISSKPWQMTVR
jgi:hypothetical protein